MAESTDHLAQSIATMGIGLGLGETELQNFDMLAKRLKS